MAKHGELFIAGKDGRNGIFKSGIVFTLASAPNFDYIYRTQCNLWEIEFASGSIDIVARTQTPLGFEQVKTIGFEKVQEALDICAINKNFFCRLASPSQTHIGVYEHKGKSTLYIYVKFHYTISMSCEVKITDAQGNTPPNTGSPPQNWDKSIRYYRLSQTSSDIYEAYRNLFLGLESLLSIKTPRKPKSKGRETETETEREWLKRSLNSIPNKKILQQLAMKGNKPPADQIITRHYRDIRCKIQHAKQDAMLLHSQIEPTKVQDGYEELLNLWRLIAAEYLKLPLIGGFEPYQTFEQNMDKNFGKELSVQYTNDSSPVSDEDTSVSPRGEPTFHFKHSKYLGKVRPGVVRIEASDTVKMNDERFLHPIHRIACVADQNIGPILSMNPGILVTGVDEFRYILDLKIENTSMPRINF